MQHHRGRGYGEHKPPFPQDLVDPIIKAGFGALGRYIGPKVNAFLVKYLGPLQEKFTKWKQATGKK